MRGRPGCPTGQEKHSVGATAGSPLFLLLQRKGWVQGRPSSDPASPGHLWFMVASPGPDRTVPRTVRPPRGRLWRLSFAKMLSSIFSLENASQIGLSIPEETAPLSYQSQRSPKRANESERAMNPGVQGRSPGPLSPHFSGEMVPPAGQAGPPGRCAPRAASELPTRRYAPPPAPPHTGAWLTRAATARAARTPEAPPGPAPGDPRRPRRRRSWAGRSPGRGESFSRAE